MRVRRDVATERITLQEAGAAYGVTARVLARWVQRGLLPAERRPHPGGYRYYVDPADVERVVAARAAHIALGQSVPHRRSAPRRVPPHLRAALREFVREVAEGRRGGRAARERRVSRAPS